MIKTVLLVDDDPDIRTIASMALSAAGGLDVVLAASGERALALALEAPPDAILMDVMMPGQDGIATFHALRKHATLVDVPVVFLTAAVTHSDRVRYREIGAKGVIQKPFDAMRLADQLRELVAS
jgi:DNA-binding response OmpR family regulator